MTLANIEPIAEGGEYTDRIDRRSRTEEKRPAKPTNFCAVDTYKRGRQWATGGR